MLNPHEHDLGSYGDYYDLDAHASDCECDLCEGVMEPWPQGIEAEIDARYRYEIAQKRSA